MAALIMAATFVVGLAVFGGVLIPAGYFEADVDPGRKVAILADNRAVVSISYLVSFLVFGSFLVVLALALYDRLKDRAPARAQVGTAFGLVWAGLVIASGMVANVGIRTVVELYRTDPGLAGSVWSATESVQPGSAGGTRSPAGCGSCSSVWQPCGQVSSPGH